MPALIDDDLTLFGGRADWETDPHVMVDPLGFDSVKQTLCFRGTNAELMNLIPIGSQSCPGFSGKPMFFIGPRVTEARFGYLIAVMEWRGMLEDRWSAAPIGTIGFNSSLYVRSASMTVSTREDHWPKEVNGQTVYLKAPYAPDDGLRTFGVSAGAGTVIPTAQVPYRTRMIGRVRGMKLSGIIAGPRSVLERPPVMAAAIDPDPGGFNWATFPDSLVTWAEEFTGGAQSAWVCRDYQTSMDTPLGDRVLSRWDASYELVKRFGP